MAQQVQTVPDPGEMLQQSEDQLQSNLCLHDSRIAMMISETRWYTRIADRERVVFWERKIVTIWEGGEMKREGGRISLPLLPCFPSVQLFLRRFLGQGASRCQG